MSSKLIQDCKLDPDSFAVTWGDGMRARIDLDGIHIAEHDSNLNAWLLQLTIPVEASTQIADYFTNNARERAHATEERHRRNVQALEAGRERWFKAYNEQMREAEQLRSDRDRLQWNQRAVADERDHLRADVENLKAERRGLWPRLVAAASAACAELFE